MSRRLVAIVALCALCVVAAPAREMVARADDLPNPIAAHRLAHIHVSLSDPVRFRREVVDGRTIGNGRKPKVIIDPDGHGAVVGAGVGRAGFALYPPGRLPQLITTFSRNDGAEDASVADINGDGAPDIVIGGLAGTTYVLLNPRHTRCSDVYRCRWKTHIIDTTHSSHDVVTADVDRDGAVDVVTESGVYFNGHHGATWTFAGRTLIARDGQGTSVGVLARDGIPDIVAPYKRATELARFINPLHVHADPRRRKWRVQIIDPHPRFSGNMTIAIGDVNGDGRNDILLAPMYGGGGLVWYEAPPLPGGTWKRRLIDPSVNFVHQGSLRLADFQGNGRRDIAFAEQDQSPTRRIGVFYNLRGDGSTWRLQVLSTEGGHNIKVGRIGGDTLPSILGARHGYFGGANPLVLFRNLDRSPNAGS